MTQASLAFFESLHNELHETINLKPQLEPCGGKDKSFPETALILLKVISGDYLQIFRSLFDSGHAVTPPGYNRSSAEVQR